MELAKGRIASFWEIIVKLMHLRYDYGNCITDYNCITDHGMYVLCDCGACVTHRCQACRSWRRNRAQPSSQLVQKIPEEELSPLRSAIKTGNILTSYSLHKTYYIKHMTNKPILPGTTNTVQNLQRVTHKFNFTHEFK